MSKELSLKKFFILFFVFLFLFMRADNDFGHVESGIYFDYTKSIVEDGDFNIVDQFFTHEQNKYVTKNYYYPDFHSHGSVIYWNYLYSFGLFVNKFLKLEGEQLNTLLHVSLSFSSVFFFLMGMLLLPKTIALFGFEFRKFWYFLLPIITPLYFYTVMEPGNGSIVAFPLVQILIHLYIWCLKDFTYRNMALYGGFLALSFISKVDAVFYGVLPFHAYFYFLRERKLLEITSKIAVFLLAFFLVNSLQILNDYIKYGLFSYGYIDTVFSDYNLFWEVLFSPYHGIIYYSPLYLISVLGFLYLIKKHFDGNFIEFKEKNFLLIFLGIVLLIKLYIFAGSYSHGSGVFGGRQFMSEIPTFFMCALILINKIKSRWQENLLYVFLFIWSLIVFFSYRDMSLDSANFTPWDVNSKYYFLNIVNRLGEFLYFIKELFFGFSEVGLKLKIFFLYPLGFSVIFALLKYRNLKKYAFAFLVFFGGTYTLQTSYNYYYGKKNVLLKRESGFYDNALVGNGVAMYFYYENMGSLNERLVFLKANGKEDEFKRVDKIRKRYHDEAKSQILVYPDKSIPMYKYYREFSTEHHMIDGMKKYNIPMLR
ncbi:MAG: hypothetical protein GY909_09055 [Oligoflexia bacterium]|nr:hypothetical protein [Oligoflexia bacterium]